MSNQTKPTIPITLPGRPVTAALDPDALPRYLTAQKWDPDPYGWTPGKACIWRSPSGGPYVPTPAHDDCDLSGQLGMAIVYVANDEHRHPLDVLADLLPPSSAPVAWAHLSERQRTKAIATVQDEAAKLRTVAGGIALLPAEQAEQYRAEAAALLALAELGRRTL